MTFSFGANMNVEITNNWIKNQMLVNVLILIPYYMRLNVLRIVLPNFIKMKMISVLLVQMTAINV
jgi:hypothetical protein